MRVVTNYSAGRSTKAEPEAGWHNTGISLGREQDLEAVVRDVVFLNLPSMGTGSIPIRTGSRGIHLRNQVFNVWVHQCTFHNWIDGGDRCPQ